MSEQRCRHDLLEDCPDCLRDEISRLQEAKRIYMERADMHAIAATRLKAENDKLFEEHKIAMHLLRDNTNTLNLVATERDQLRNQLANANLVARHEAAMAEGLRNQLVRAEQIPLSDEFINAFMKAEVSFVEAYEAPRESGVAVECDMSQDDADAFNAEGRNNFRSAWKKAIAALTDDLGEKK